MIIVRIFFSTVGKISGFSVTGHSGQEKRGYDIVCAGVSALTQTALLGIGEHLHREVDFDMSSGKLEVKLKSAPDDLTEAIFKTMHLGLREIEKINPEAVKIEEIRR